ncbi:MAG: hypothetical protein HY721_18825 [Planctomycetes bacterium]|nr:hypothetical protein [Planctomycetota bacterium]
MTSRWLLRSRVLPFASLLLAASPLAAGGPAAAGRHAPRDGSPGYWLLRLEPGEGAGPEAWVRGPGPREAIFFAEPPGPDGSRSWIGRSRKEPEGLTLGDGKGSATVAVDWTGAKDDPSLPERWRSAARAHFQGLAERRALDGFARYALRRLEPEGAAKEPGGLLARQERRIERASPFDLTTGRTAIEESLQLDRLRDPGRARKQEATVPLSSIEGVKVKAHPWEEMLKGRKPEPHAIERFLPLDQYAFEAASLGAFLEIADWLDAWGGQILAWSHLSAEDSGARERLERQLCLPASALARALGPSVVGRVAMTGGDPFLREGTDLTLVFELKAEPVFLANLEKNRLEAQGKVPSAKRVEAEHGGRKIAGLVAPDRAVSSYSVVAGGFALVSSSLAGLGRSLDALDGKVESQATGLDRRFVRTLVPRGEGEAAFLYLSDPFIRRLVGPELKLEERRRLECSAGLRSVAHAAAWRQARGEARAARLEELVAAGDVPPALLACPDGGAYRLLDDGRGGACAVHGTLEALTPCAELELALVTDEERQAYERFRDGYQNYWSRYFDPIGVQVSLGKTKRFETAILPLIEMSEYRQMADLFGGKEGQKGPLAEQGPGTSLLLSAHLNRESGLFRQAEGFAQAMLLPGSQQAALGWVGDRVSLFLEDAPEGLKDVGSRDMIEEGFDLLAKGAGGGVRVAVRNTLHLAAFLGALKAMILSAAPGTVVFENLPERKGTGIVKVAAREGSGGHGPEAVYYAVIGDGLHVSLRQDTLERIIDRSAPAGEKSEKPAPQPAEGAAPTAGAGPKPAPASEPTWLDGSHVALALDLAGSPRWRALLLGLYDAEARKLCAGAVETAWEMDRLGLKDGPAKRALAGAAPRCPGGGAIGAAKDGRIACSVHGAGGVGGAAATGGAGDKIPLAALSGARAKLSFTEDGVRTTLEIAE